MNQFCNRLLWFLFISVGGIVALMIFGLQKSDRNYCANLSRHKLAVFGDASSTINRSEGGKIKELKSYYSLLASRELLISDDDDYMCKDGWGNPFGFSVIEDGYKTVMTVFVVHQNDERKKDIWVRLTFTDSETEVVYSEK